MINESEPTEASAQFSTMERESCTKAVAKAKEDPRIRILSGEEPVSEAPRRRQEKELRKKVVLLLTTDLTVDQSRQVLRDLTGFEWQALLLDVRRHGVQVPIEVDERHVVVDGHHRYKAALEAGLALVPCIVREAGDPARVRTRILSLNLRRRHLSLDEIRAVVAPGAKAQPGRRTDLGTNVPRLPTKKEADEKAAAATGKSTEAVKKQRLRGQRKVSGVKHVKGPNVSGQDSTGIAAGRIVLLLKRAIEGTSRLHGASWKRMSPYWTRVAIGLANPLAELAKTLQALKG